MRRGGLKRRAAAPDTPASTTSSVDPTVDPPIVAKLVQPMLALRASLGTGVGTPDATITSALSNASAQAADTEAPHRDGMHALESSWSGPGSDAAVPALRTTQTQIGDISDRGPAYLAVLADAHTTTAKAAQQVDQIIAGFRKDARTILGNATAAPDTDAVITRATQALREAISAVTTAQSEMAGHTRRLDQMGPLTVSAPGGVTDAAQYTPYSSDTPYSPDTTNPGEYVPDTTVPGAYSPGMTPGGYSPNTSMVPAQVTDPAQAAQLQLQQQLIAAGVQVGTAAISAGVDIGTHLIDKISELGTHTIDAVASSADKVIPQLIHPGTTTNGDNTTGGDSGNSSKLFDFGGGGSQSAPTGTGAVIPPGQNTPGSNNAKPGSDGPQPGSDQGAAQPPAAAAQPAPDTTPAPQPAVPQPAAPQQPGSAGGLALPPPPIPGDQDQKPRDGQLGVTAPAALQMVPTAVIGDVGDDTI